uniref:Uncharacterized protein n=1 Tax=Arundo donax TaxID=35708 RepID=A0A0A9EAH6_ARUDO
MYVFFLSLDFMAESLFLIFLINSQRSSLLYYNTECPTRLPSKKFHLKKHLLF